MLPKQAVNEYKKLFKARYGVELSYAEAERRANNLVAFYRAVLKPTAVARAEKKKVKH